MSIRISDYKIYVRSNRHGLLLMIVGVSRYCSRSTPLPTGYSSDLTSGPTVPSSIGGGETLLSFGSIDGCRKIMVATTMNDLEPELTITIVKSANLLRD